MTTAAGLLAHPVLHFNNNAVPISRVTPRTCFDENERTPSFTSTTTLYCFRVLHPGRASTKINELREGLNPTSDHYSKVRAALFTTIIVRATVPIPIILCDHGSATRLQRAGFVQVVHGMSVLYLHTNTNIGLTCDVRSTYVYTIIILLA